MLILAVLSYPDGSFKILRELREHDPKLTNAVITVDYKYTPWFRKGGNLLWS